MNRMYTHWASALLLFFLVTYPTRAQVIFRDDFDRAAFGEAWINPSYADWSIVDGKAYNFIDGQGGTLQTNADFPQASYVIETQAYPFNRNYYRQYGITFGKPDAGLDFGYILKYQAYSQPRLVLGRAEGNEFYPVLLDDSLITLDENKQYTFRIEHSNSGLIKVFLNDGSGYGSSPILQATDNTYKTLGHLGWRVDTETYAESFYVEWLEARYLDEPAPFLLTNVQASSGKTYAVDRLFPGSSVYVDRSYTFIGLPSYLNGATYIRTANDDKKRKDAGYLTFELTDDAHVYVFYDPRDKKIPSWLNSWQQLEDRVYTTDTGTFVLDVYTKTYGAGTLKLGGNLASPATGALTNFLVAAVPAMDETIWEAEKATLSGPLAASNHPGYSGNGFADFINPVGDSLAWTVNVPAAGNYQLGFRYALANKSRPMAIQVNGVTLDTALVFSPTGTWSAWRLISLGTLLKAGANTIALVANGSSGPNLDYLVVKADVVYPSSGRVAAPGVLAAGGIGETLSNYPNPVSHRTTIRYQVAEASRVTLAVYNAQGRAVATLLDNEPREAGTYEQNFDAGLLPGGVYFYRLQTRNRQQTAKMVLNR